MLKCEKIKEIVGSDNHLMETVRQKIIVFQQNGSGEKKIQGLTRYGAGLFDLHIMSVDAPLPAVLDETEEYLPTSLEADLVLDFLVHPDLSHDLARLCEALNIPIVASGKKHRVKWAVTPPT